MTQLGNSNQQTAIVDSNRRPREHVPGYSAVLLRTELKTLLWNFRRSQGLPCDGQAERCLSSALFELVLNDVSLHGRWMERYWASMQADALVVREALNAPSETGVARRVPVPEPSSA